MIALVPGEGPPAWRSQRVTVETGARRAGQVEVVRGLAEGDRIVTAGQQRVQRDGTPLRLADAGRRAPAPEERPASAPPPASAAPAAGAAVPARAAATLPWAATPPGPGPCAVAR